jgi:hypothetical protein
VVRRFDGVTRSLLIGPERAKLRPAAISLKQLRLPRLLYVPLS